jgi:hypothetical protein
MEERKTVPDTVFISSFSGCAERAVLQVQPASLRDSR